MSSVGVVHPGTQHSWQTARALDDAGQLGWYATSIYWLPDRMPYRLARLLPAALRAKVEREFSRFYHPDLDPRRVRTFAGSEWVMRIAGRLGWTRTQTFFMRRGNSALAGPVSRLMSREPVGAVWCYDGAALEVFEAAQRGGLRTILDRTIGHPLAYHEIMQGVRDRYPEFIPAANYLPPADFIERIDREHVLADVILNGSPFCAGTVASHTKVAGVTEKLKVVPYCYDDKIFHSGLVRQPTKGFPIRFLFTGQAGPRKGFHLVLKAFERIPKEIATLTVVGSLDLPPEILRRFGDRFIHHPTVPRAEVANFMREADCLLLPSYFEGAGLVLYEAAAMGLAIIQSCNADQFLPEESPGLMARVDEDELSRCIAAFLDRPDLLEQESRLNLTRCQTYTFAAYRDRVNAVVSHLL